MESKEHQKEHQQEWTDKNSNGRKHGRITRLKGSYGFIRNYPPGQPRYDLFFHKSALVGRNFKQVEPGDFVSFEEGENDRGPVAVKVQVENENHNIN